MKFEKIKKINDFLYEIPKGYKPGMHVPARIYGSKTIIENMDNAELVALCKDYRRAFKQILEVIQSYGKISNDDLIGLVDRLIPSEFK